MSTSRALGMNAARRPAVFVAVKRSAAVSLLALFAAGCGAAPTPRATVPRRDEVVVVQTTVLPPEPTAAVAWVDPYASVIDDAVRLAASGGRRVLEAAAAMLDEAVVVRGSCWDWASAVLERAGGISTRVFRGRKTGPWAEADTLAPGDWLYFVHADGVGTHSAIFVGWADEAAHVGLTISYVGGNREEPGRYSTYDLSRVYRVIRMGD